MEFEIIAAGERWVNSIIYDARRGPISLRRAANSDAALTLPLAGPFDCNQRHLNRAPPYA